MKIKPSDETKTISITNEKTQVSDLISLIPSQDEIEKMNFKKHAYLQKMRKNSQMDISDQKSLVD